MVAPRRILFVCYGNIVRSPLAEALFRREAAAIGARDRYDVASAGTSGLYDGQPPHPGTLRVAEAHGLSLTTRSRRFAREDFDRFDHILALDRHVAGDLELLARTAEQRQKVRLLRTFDPQASGEADVPDPIGSGPDAFERAFEIIERSVRGLLQSLEATEG